MNKLWIVAASTLLASCSSTRITSSWKNDNVPSTYYNRIMVAALIPDNQRNVQQAMENGMVEQLRRKGYNAVSAFQEYGPRAFSGLSESATLKKIKGSRADAVITITQINHSRTRRYVPGSIYPGPWGWGWGPYAPGYVANDNRYAWETNFYEMGDGKMLYSVQSRSFDPSSAYDLAECYSRQIVKDMKEKGVLIKKGRDVASNP